MAKVSVKGNARAGQRQLLGGNSIASTGTGINR
jgi:hypothetical protein